MGDSKKSAASDAAETTDPEILKLLDFEPVQRRHKRPDGWTPALQRLFIARLAELGSCNAATEALGKNRYGVEKLYKSAGAEGFRAAWDSAVALFEEREAERIARENAPFAGVKPPFADRRSKASTGGPLPGQVMNERGEWEDEASFIRRGEEARDNICAKLLNCRRLYLMEISGSAGKRAAFEILTELPIDWERAARMEPQADEPWKRPNQREPDMILTAENGWSFGEHGYGDDRKAEMRAELDKYRAEEGLEPVDWDEEDAPVSSSPTEIGDPAPSPEDRSGPRVRRI